MASGVFGLLVGTIGIVPTGEWRATFNEPYLAEGMPIIPVLIGMFVFSELMLMTFRDYVIDSTITVKRSLRDIFGGFRLPAWTLPAFHAVHRARHHRRPAACGRRHGSLVCVLFAVAKDIQARARNMARAASRAWSRPKAPTTRAPAATS